MKQEILEGYLNAILLTFRIDKEEFFKKSKRRELSDARYFLYYLCKNRPISLVNIQKFMAENGYSIPLSTIFHGVNAIAKKVETDDDYFRAIQKINNKVKF